MNYDFSGFATKSGLKCSDGRTIGKDAFKGQNGMTVPLVWQHLHNEPANVLGHAILESKNGDIYCYGKFNNTPSGKNAKELVCHGDINSLSIYANQLQEKSKTVLHGIIREVSLVLSGANPGALIDNLSIAHGDGTDRTYTEDETEAIIYTGLELEHADSVEEAEVPPTKDKKLEHADSVEEAEVPPTKDKKLVHADEDMTVQEVFDTLTEEQKTVVYAMIAHALSDEDGEDEEIKHSNYEGAGLMKNNVFDQNLQHNQRPTLDREQMQAIMDDARKCGSLKESFLAHAEEYGFDPIDVLFPDARLVNPNGPELIKRDDTWVSILLGEATHTPFSRIKSYAADITADEARAKGYVTGSLKKEEVIALMRRVTTPTTIYKKQKLDRDDMLDITDFDVVVWLKREMRMMLNEELARAALLGDGRSVAEEDKINEQNIRPIVLDNPAVYIHRIEIDADTPVDEIIDEIIRARKFYKGSGSPSFYTSTDLLTEMLLVKDGMGRRMYSNVTELSSVLRASKIVEVEPMNDAVRVVNEDEEIENKILGVLVNMKDYTIGADKGGDVAMFDDFDIDYNQYKYLLETRCSGALTKPKSAIVFEMKPAEEEGA